jgi:hypothetical protein
MYYLCHQKVEGEAGSAGGQPAGNKPSALHCNDDRKGGIDMPPFSFIVHYRQCFMAKKTRWFPVSIKSRKTTFYKQTDCISVISFRRQGVTD